MSRIGKLPVQIPSGVSVTVQAQKLSIKGPKGVLNISVHPQISVVVEEGKQIVFSRPNDSKENRALHGLSRALAQNMVVGVTVGFEKKLEVRGVGYRFVISGKKITLNLGFSHPIEYKIPEGITIVADEELKNTMVISGIDKQLVGEVSAQIRGFRKPEPYKGKGIRYTDEYVATKQGKAAAK